MTKPVRTRVLTQSAAQISTATLHQIETARLEQRVHGLETGQKELSNDLQAFDAKFSAQLQSVANSVASQINELASKMDDRSRTPWGVILSLLTFIFLILSGLGALAYLPIKQAQEFTQGELRLLRETTMSRADHDREIRARSESRERDIARIERDIDKLERAEIERLRAEALKAR